MNEIRLKSWLPESGENLFQRIKTQRAQAEKQGVKIIDLSIGQPKGPAMYSTRVAAANAVMSTVEEMHEYQDNGSPGVPDFAEKFVRYHVSIDPANNVAFLPIPGIKSMLSLVIMACNAGYQNKQSTRMKIVTATNPGYPTPAYWAMRLGQELIEPDITTTNFKIQPKQIDKDVRLVMLNYPHNPSGQVMLVEDWAALCIHCRNHEIRVFNDSAYSGLLHDKSGRTLSQVAQVIEGLSWAEAFSASKLIGNGTGWRVGAIAGSTDFIADIAREKGNADSGFFAPAAAGVLAAVENYEYANGADTHRQMKMIKVKYENRISKLTAVLKEEGMKLAVEPKAGFFTLWEAPEKAFGQKIVDGEHFNALMIVNTGVTGVPFGRFIRYAVSGSAVDESLEDIKAGFQKALG